MSGRKWGFCIRPSGILVAGLILGGLALRATAADDKTPLELLPATTAIYAEVPAPGALVAAIMDHPLAQRLEKEDAFQQALATPQYGAFRLGLGFVELNLGMTWRKAIEAFAEGGATVGVDAQTNGVALLVRARDEATLNRFRDLFLKFARDEARKKGNPDPVTTAEYRGITAYRVDRARFATLGRLLVVTQNDDLGKSIVDAWLDGNRQNLGADATFAKARAARGADPVAWAYVRLDVLREKGVAQKLFAGQSENIVGELLLGGILTTLQKSPYATARLDVDQAGLRLALAAPHDRAWTPASRQFYFGADGKGAAPGVLTPPGTLLNLTAFRDLAGLWNSAPELLDQKANAELAQANSNLSNLFGGQDFGQDVLTTVLPDWQLVIARQKYADESSQPQLKLPAGAIVFRLKDPEKSRRAWKVTFQSLIGFLNIVGAMERRPPFELDSQQADGALFVTATYGPPTENGKLRPGAIYYNFSPTMVTVGDRLILSSAQSLARDLARLEPKPIDPSSPTVVNTRLRLDLPNVREALVDNRGQLIAQNMLEKGHPRPDAEREIDTLLVLAKLLGQATVQLDTTADQVRFGLEISVNPQAP